MVCSALLLHSGGKCARLFIAAALVWRCGKTPTRLPNLDSNGKEQRTPPTSNKHQAAATTPLPPSLPPSLPRQPPSSSPVLIYPAVDGRQACVDIYRGRMQVRVCLPGSGIERAAKDIQIDPGFPDGRLHASNHTNTYTYTYTYTQL